MRVCMCACVCVYVKSLDGCYMKTRHAYTYILTAFAINIYQVLLYVINIAMYIYM